MSPSPASARVLVASDRTADATHVQRLLGDEFEHVEVSVRDAESVADFERVRPDVVVLAFDTVKKSQDYCLGLLRFSKVAQSLPHRHVVLCGSGDVDLAFALCKKNHYDDYVLYWPQPHDGHRLVMAVWNAFRQLEASRGQLARIQELESHAISASTLGAVVHRQLAAGEGHVAAIAPPWLEQMAAWMSGFRSEVAPHVSGLQALAQTVSTGRPVVLVVDDDAFASKLIGKALEHQAFDVEFAADAKAVFDVLRRLRPVAILMDINLPGMDGLTLTTWIKGSPMFAQIPVLMLTGEATREAIERSKAVGAADFIVKPFTRDSVLAKLKRILA